MNVHIITNSFMSKVDDLIDNNEDFFNERKGFLECEVKGRLIAIKNIALTPIAAVGDCFKGILFAGLSLITLGLNRKINILAANNLFHSMKLIPQIFRSALQIINPKSDLDSSETKGFFTKKVYSKIRSLEKPLRDGNRLKRNILLRVISVIRIPTFVITRVADFALGVIAAVGAVLTVGKFEKLNSFAYRNLQVMQVVRDIYMNALTVINPDPVYY